MSDLITTDPGRAAAALAAGGLVAVPTETVYGLAADATNVEAVRRIYATKGRPREHPLIVHLADPADLAAWSPDASAAAQRLADTCWPGPLTVIVPRHEPLPADVAGGRDTVGLRVPAHDLTRAVIDELGAPIAAPSANLFGAVSPTTAHHVLDDLAGVLDPRRDLILDGGPCPVGVESTIVDCTVDPAQLLREGAVSREQVADLLADVAEVTGASGPPRASGMLASHYAPRCEVRPVDAADDASALAAGTRGARILDLTHDLTVYARRLYGELRRADDDGVEVLIAVLPPAEGIGHAIRDRLRKAAAPRG